MKKTIFLFSFLLLFFVDNTKGEIPLPPNPPRLVNDFASLFTAQQLQHLESLLVTFNDSTSNVICIVTVNELAGYDAAEFAYRIGEDWGVRDKKQRNGIVFLIKPRNNTSGEVYIAVGYDLEGVLPDAKVKRIIDQNIIPHFKNGHYYEGVEEALSVMFPLISGEISEKREKNSPFWPLFLFLGFLSVFFILSIIASRKNKNKGGGNSSSKNGDFTRRIWMGNMSSGSGGRGGFSGGFGGYGGGGGGGFGGGGARGKF